MSLTGLLNSNKEVKEFFNNIKPRKEEFYTLSGKKPFSKEYEERFPYNLNKPYDSTLVGTAFDYISRFEIARNIKFNKEKSYEMLYEGIPKKGLGWIECSISYQSIMSKFKEELYDAIDLAKQYVNLQTNSIEVLFEKSLYLARLEHCYRTSAGSVYNLLESNGLSLNSIHLTGGELTKVKELIKIDGTCCCLYIYHKINTIEDRVTVKVEAYDKDKNKINDFELKELPKEFKLNPNTSFIKLNIMINGNEINLDDIVRITINHTSEEKLNSILNLFTRFDKNLIDELNNIFIQFREHFVKNIIKEDSIVVFNPSFGKASRLVGGADADIYIDDVLYDFKTTKNYGYSGKDISQIIGYFLLKSIDEKYPTAKNEYFKEEPSLLHYDINRLAFYKARFGEIEYLDTSYLNNFNKKKLIGDFEDLLKRINPRFNEIIKENY